MARTNRLNACFYLENCLVQEKTPAGKKLLPMPIKEIKRSNFEGRDVTITLEDDRQFTFAEEYCQKSFVICKDDTRLAITCLETCIDTDFLPITSNLFAGRMLFRDPFDMTKLYVLDKYSPEKDDQNCYLVEWNVSTKSPCVPNTRIPVHLRLPALVEKQHGLFPEACSLGETNSVRFQFAGFASTFPFCRFTAKVAGRKVWFLCTSSAHFFFLWQTQEDNLLERLAKEEEFHGDLEALKTSKIQVIRCDDVANDDGDAVSYLMTLAMSSRTNRATTFDDDPSDATIPIVVDLRCSAF